jgi:hypothetical protein
MANVVNKNNSKIKIGLSEIVGILLSLVSLYVAATQLINGNIINFLVALIAGLIIMPFGWKQIESKLTFSLSLPLRVIIWIILMTVSVYIS